MKLLARASALLSTAVVATALAVVPTTAAHAATSVFPVPTSNAGLGRITTAPDGAMWFIMSEVGKVGRITPSGQINEFPLPATTTGEVDGSVYGLDVAPDGKVWVTYDYGRKILSIDPVAVTGTTYGLGAYPYGGDVRVGPDGRVFVTMNYDDSGVATLAPGAPDFFWSANAPACDDALGEAADGSMWCQGGDDQDTIVHLNADASGGVTYPLPSDATYPNALAAGPVGSIWFTRSSSGTIFTSPNSGSVGYLDQASGATQIWSTGSRTAPSDLIQAPDGTMWFTNRGAAPAIGHINAAGVGAITAVGNYEPTSLTWGADGAIWFTDAKNNSIVRVTTDQLQTTNVDLGDGVTMTAPTTPGTPVPPNPGTQVLPTGSVAKARGVVKVKKLKVPVKVACPAAASQGCSGTVTVSVKKKAITKKAPYRLAAGSSTTVRAKVTAKGKRLLKPGRRTKVSAALTAVGATKPGARRSFTVVRK